MKKTKTPFVLGTNKFLTKDAITKYAKFLKQEVGTRYPKGTGAYAFFHDLFTLGYYGVAEKMEGDVVEFRVVENDPSGYTRVDIVLADGRTRDISYRKCIQNLRQDIVGARAADIYQKKRRAYRQAASDYNMHFKRTKLNGGCEQCGALPGDGHIFEVHHASVLHSDIIHNFEEECVKDGLRIPDRLSDFVDVFVAQFGVCVQTFKDAHYAARWAAYHEKHAVLQLLCVECHAVLTREEHLAAQAHTHEEK